MRKFLIKLGIRLSIMAVICGAYGWIKWSPDYYASIPFGTSYGKLEWIHNKLKSNAVKDGSVIFLGSSICMNSVNDSLLGEWDSTDLKYHNLGLPHTCYAIVHEVLEDIVEVRGIQPKKVYLCLKSDAIAINIHKMYPLAADASDILESVGQGNVLAGQTYFKRIAWNNNFFTRSFKLKTLDSTYISASNYGFRYHLPIDSLESEKNYKRQSVISTPNFDAIEKVNNGESPNWKLQLLLFHLDWLENVHFQKECVRNSIALLERLGIEYDIILYPNLVLHRQQRVQVMLDYYYRTFPEIKANGHEIIYFDGDYLGNAKYWVDMNHLNKDGAELLTKELFEKIK